MTKKEKKDWQEELKVQYRKDYEEMMECNARQRRELAIWQFVIFFVTISVMVFFWR